MEPTKKLFLDCIHWANEFLELEPEKKHDVVKKVLWNFSMKDEIVFSYNLKSPYDTIAKAPKNGDLETLRYSLYKIRTYFESNPDDTDC